MELFHSLADAKLPALITNGSVGVLPTDTIYGLVCMAADDAAVKRLYALKSREHKPGTVIAANVDQLVELGIKARYLKAVEQFWPGEVSVVIPSGPELDYLHLGLMGLAIRITGDQALSNMIKNTGALLTSSANLPGKPVANTIKEAEKYFGEKVDFYVDGGDLSSREPSTIIRIVDDAIEIVRQGNVKISESGRIER